MNFRTTAVPRVLLCSLFAMLSFASLASAQEAPKGPATKSKEEFDAYSQMTQAATDQMRIELGQKFLADFKESELRPVVYREVIFALARADKHDEAFQAADAGFKEDPTNLTLLMHMAYDASDQALRGNKSFIAGGKTFGERALAALTTGARPNEYTAETWAAQKPMRIAVVYRSLGVLESESAGRDKAIEYFHLALKEDQTDGLTNFLLARQQLQVYEEARAKALSEKRPARKKELVDEVKKIGDEALRSYARASVLSAAKPEMAGFHEGVDTEFKKVFGLMHSGSMEGIDAIIEAAKAEIAN